MPHWSSSRPAASAQLMIRLAHEHGVTTETCLAGTGLCGDDLVDPAREIAGHQELSVLRNILRALGPTVPFGLLAGQRYRMTTFGTWGLAIITSASVRDAIDVGLRYLDLTPSFNRVSFELRRHQAHLVYEDCDNPEDLRAALVERDMAVLIAIQREVLGEAIPIRSLQLRAQRPPYAAEFAPLFGVAPQFGASLNCIAIDAARLDVSGPFADWLGQRVAEQECRFLVEHRGERSGVADRIRARLLRRSDEFPSMQTVACELGLSTRTLRNQLQREAVSYRDLVDGVRSRLAEELLVTTRMTVRQIAERLGYADTSSFITAFKRWKGMPPRDYRSERRPSE